MHKVQSSHCFAGQSAVSRSNFSVGYVGSEMNKLWRHSNKHPCVCGEMERDGKAGLSASAGQQMEERVDSAMALYGAAWQAGGRAAGGGAPIAAGPTLFSRPSADSTLERGRQSRAMPPGASCQDSPGNIMRKGCPAGNCISRSINQSGRASQRQELCGGQSPARIRLGMIHQRRGGAGRCCSGSPQRSANSRCNKMQQWHNMQQEC